MTGNELSLLVSKQTAHDFAPVDQRVQNFLKVYLDCDETFLPEKSLILDEAGQARLLSIPMNGHSFKSKYVSSYRASRGVLHNPKSDRRTTKGVFHVADGGLPIPEDKKVVPKEVFKQLLLKALVPPEEDLLIPYSESSLSSLHQFVSLYMRPLVSPEVPGHQPEKRTEIRFFAPGSLISNLDFVESIFGNGGNPFLPENDAALDIQHWTGHTGCVILAPHLIELTKKELGLPHIDQATERQKRDGMCWTNEDEQYNEGGAFKVTCRDKKGVMVTLIADNYFGYCKKEVKTQISYSANLFGLAEEEHSGGAIAFPSYNLGKKFVPSEEIVRSQNRFEQLKEYDFIDFKPEGYGVDKQHASLYYLPEEAEISLLDQAITWKGQSIKLLPSRTYIYPSGYSVVMEKQEAGTYWRLVGTAAEGTLCHKPCTVSGGGKSEISKSIEDAIVQGPVFVSNIHEDFKTVEELLKKDYSDRFKDFANDSSRPILNLERSLGSVIKLLTYSEDYTAAYNEWLQSIPDYIRNLVFIVKRYYKQEWGENWQEHFSVDFVNGSPGHELKYDNQELVSIYCRVGFEQDESSRIFNLRQDFIPAEKLQMEDDITASIVVPKEWIQDLNTDYSNASVKIVENCESRLFQRPDDAIIRGYDKQAEADLASEGTFFSNYEPLNLHDAKELIEEAIGFNRFTRPMKLVIKEFYKNKSKGFFISSAHPRLWEGKPSKNPRYLQNRPDLVDPQSRYLAEVKTRLHRNIPIERPVQFNVNAVLPGRRNNAPEPKNGIPALAVYNPIHYQELPELFMDFISSLTGKSPSTTGFGTEGALTKGPFNALLPIIDLNNALVSYLLTEYDVFSSAAGHVGPKYRFAHDVSLLIPEIWSRMEAEEQKPKYLIEQGYLEPVEDFEHKGQTVLASRVGYRITIKFVNSFLGRIFNKPSIVFNEEMLRPELQGIDLFVEGINNIVLTQKKVAENYFKDGSIDLASPPLKALLTIMRDGDYDGKGIASPEVRNLFTRDALIKSDWYRARLEAKQQQQRSFWENQTNYLKSYSEQTESTRSLLQQAEQQLAKVQRPEYLESLFGTIGLDPSLV